MQEQYYSSNFHSQKSKLPNWQVATCFLSIHNHRSLAIEGQSSSLAIIHKKIRLLNYFAYFHSNFVNRREYIKPTVRPRLKGKTFFFATEIFHSIFSWQKKLFIFFSVNLLHDLSCQKNFLNNYHQEIDIFRSDLWYIHSSEYQIIVHVHVEGMTNWNRNEQYNK